MALRPYNNITTNINSFKLLSYPFDLFNTFTSTNSFDICFGPYVPAPTASWILVIIEASYANGSAVAWCYQHSGRSWSPTCCTPTPDIGVICFLQVKLLLLSEILGHIAFLINTITSLCYVT